MALALSQVLHLYRLLWYFYTLLVLSMFAWDVIGTISNASADVSAARTLSGDQETVLRPEYANSKDTIRASMPESPKASDGGTTGTSTHAQSRRVPLTSSGLPGTG